MGASLIGVLASWWMGLIIGLPVAVVTLFAPDPKIMRRLFVRTSILVVVLTLLSGLVALLYALIVFSSDYLPIWMDGRIVSNPVRFSQAANMHNHSYLGGLIGLIVGLVYALWNVRRLRGRVLAFKD